MAKVIRITDADIEKIKEDFVESLKKMKLADGKITYTKDVGKIDCKADLFYTEIAWLKQCMLVNEFDKEVAWHGIARRGDDPEKNEYIIEDIIVYPQEVTGATVNTDQEEYEKWLDGLDDDVFRKVRMQGHSHVNMGVSPSATDEALYEQLLSQLRNDMFYVFVIWNKKGDKTVKIYDFGKNILFETSDVTVSILDNGDGFGDFIDNAKNMVKTKSWSSSYNKGSSYYNKPYTPSLPPTSYNNTAKTNDKKEKKGRLKKKSFGSEDYEDSLNSMYEDLYGDGYGKWR